MGSNMDIGTEEKKLAIEIISVLVHIKQTMIDLLFIPAGISPAIYKPILNKRDEISNRPLSKRKMAPIILEEVSKLQNGDEIIYRIIKICSLWSSFHLAENEYEARAVVEKAKHVVSKIEKIEEKKTIIQREQDERKKLDKANERNAQLRLLLMSFYDQAKSSDHQQRGYLLQDLLNRLFTICEIPVEKSYFRNEGGEQIDGAFRFQGWHYLVECKWTKKLADIGDLDSLLGKVNRSGRQTMGMFLSIEGWSENIPRLLKQNPEKCIILMDGYDLQCVLDSQIELEILLEKKISSLNLDSEPFLSARTIFNNND